MRGWEIRTIPLLRGGGNVHLEGNEEEEEEDRSRIHKEKEEKEANKE